MNVKIIGGVNEGNEEKGTTTFFPKRTVVVERDKVGTLFRRDWVMCSYPVIKIVNTNEEPTIYM